MIDRPLGQSEQSGAFAGLLRLARGDASGIMCFGHTTRAFLLSLIPLIALPLLLALATVAGGNAVRALGDMAASVCVLLLPPVLSHALAGRWNREQAWLRFAVAFNWTQFGLSVACMGLLIVLGIVLGSTGTGPDAAGAMLVVALLCLGIVGYGLWLHWFVTKSGLGVSGKRAAFLVFATYVGNFAILLVRGLLLMQPA